MNIKDCLLEKIQDQPFLIEGINEKLINVSALARKLKPEIEELMGSTIKENAIIMALNRLEIKEFHSIKKEFKRAAKELGDITVRSGIIDCTIKNEVNNDIKINKIITSVKGSFSSFSKGINETTIIVNNEHKQTLLSILSKNEITSIVEDLSAITIHLPKGNSSIPGLYYFLLGKMAWRGISLIELISTTNEFTMILKNRDIGKALETLMELKS